MTIHEAKRDCRTRLNRYGIDVSRITARTVGFSDLMGSSCIFVELHQPTFPPGVTLRDINNDIPKPSQGGYIVRIH